MSDTSIMAICDVTVCLLQADSRELSETLTRTEATVRIQTDKMKFYRAQLELNGIAPRSPSPGPRSPSPTTRSRSPGSGCFTSEVSASVAASHSPPPPPLSADQSSTNQRNSHIHHVNDNDVAQLKSQVEDLTRQLSVYERRTGGGGDSASERPLDVHDEAVVAEPDVNMTSFYRFKVRPALSL